MTAGNAQIFPSINLISELFSSRLDCLHIITEYFVWTLLNFLVFSQMSVCSLHLGVQHVCVCVR